MEKIIPAPWPTPLYKHSMTSMLWIFPLASLAIHLALLPPSSCTPPHQPNTGNWKKVRDFLATTKTISIINILLILNSKHSSYWKENQLFPTHNQDSQLLT